MGPEYAGPLPEGTTTTKCHNFFLPADINMSLLFDEIGITEVSCSILISCV